jgi:proliferating cell nuclear antigen PCNA
MTIIFKAKTQDAYVIKILAELLSYNIKTACFEVDENGINLCMMDHHRRILIDLELHAQYFTKYIFSDKIPSGKMFLGINLNHFHRMLKSIKKKDSIQLFIDDEFPTDLGIKVIPKENNRVTVSVVKIQSIQNLVIDKPDKSRYGKPIIVSSSEYQKMVKDMGSIGTTMKVTSKNFFIEFNCDAGGILKRKVQFGEMDDSDEEREEEDSEEYCQEFVTEQLSRITKMAGLSQNMQIFPGRPLFFRSDIGSLGKISIYIKSKEQLELESHTIEDDDDEDDEY